MSQERKVISIFVNEVTVWGRAVLEHFWQPVLPDLGQLTVRIKVLYTQGLDMVGWRPGRAPGEAYLFLFSETQQAALLPDPGLARAVCAE